MKMIQGEEYIMTLLSYQVFMAVVEQESFQKAAQVLQLTPSAISHAVAGMESELGFPLFIRSKQGVYLTNYGKELFPYIKNVLNSDEYLHQADFRKELYGSACSTAHAWSGCQVS